MIRSIAHSLRRGRVLTVRMPQIEWGAERRAEIRLWDAVSEGVWERVRGLIRDQLRIDVKAVDL